jgi:hypothetical protein
VVRYFPEMLMYEGDRKHGRRPMSRMLSMATSNV